tara:strand:- start:83 stop:550 length:468 start_codon:yes stop_codon:yes gene_type:complete
MQTSERVMKKIILIILFGLIFSDDKLVLLDGSIYNGDFIAFQGDNVIFKPTGSFSSQKLEVTMIKSLTLSDGTMVPIQIPEKKSSNIYLAGKKMQSASNKLLAPIIISGIAIALKEPNILLVSCAISFGFYIWAIFDLKDAGDFLVEESGVLNSE